MASSFLVPLSVALLCLALSGWASSAAARQCNIFVDGRNGDDQRHNGTSWRTPFQTMGAAAFLISNRTLFPHPTAVVCVAPGVYKDQKLHLVLSNENQTLRHLTIRGLHGSDCTASSRRPLEVCPVILYLQVIIGSKEPPPPLDKLPHLLSVNIHNLWVETFLYNVMPPIGWSMPARVSAWDLVLRELDMRDLLGPVVQMERILVSPRPFVELLGVKSYPPKVLISSGTQNYSAAIVWRSSVMEGYQNDLFDEFQLFTLASVTVENSLFAQGKFLTLHVEADLTIRNTTFRRFDKVPYAGDLVCLADSTSITLQDLSFIENRLSGSLIDSWAKRATIEGCYFDHNVSPSGEPALPPLRQRYNATVFTVGRGNRFNERYDPPFRCPTDNKVSPFGLFGCEDCPSGLKPNHNRTACV
ncbi:hypothetical protein QOT17_010607 [Balamuthia mandrillaris]